MNDHPDWLIHGKYFTNMPTDWLTTALVAAETGAERDGSCQDGASASSKQACALHQGDDRRWHLLLGKDSQDSGTCERWRTGRRPTLNSSSLSRRLVCIVQRCARKQGGTHVEGGGLGIPRYWFWGQSGRIAVWRVVKGKHLSLWSRIELPQRDSEMSLYHL